MTDANGNKSRLDLKIPTYLKEYLRDVKKNRGLQHSAYITMLLEQDKRRHDEENRPTIHY